MLHLLDGPVTFQKWEFGKVVMKEPYATFIMYIYSRRHCVRSATPSGKATVPCRRPKANSTPGLYFKLFKVT
jgi:hypothetical protein